MIYNIQNFITDFYSLRSECESKIQINFPTVFGGKIAHASIFIFLKLCKKMLEINCLTERILQSKCIV